MSLLSHPALTSEVLGSVLSEKLSALEQILVQHAPLLIAYSGGVDSACLLALAQQVLGGAGSGESKYLGIIADSPSLPRQSLADAVALAESVSAPLEVVRTAEMENPDYASNPVNRCYFCKAELFMNMERIAGERQFAALAYGENADDPAHLRPGSQAAKEFAVIAPLKAAGLTKAEIRTISRALGLPTADAPAQPCLSSRIPHGTPVTPQALALVEKGEALVRSLGFQVFRVRHLVEPSGALRAKVQIAPGEMAPLPELQPEIERGLIAVGYHSIEIDPAGYR